MNELRFCDEIENELRIYREIERRTKIITKLVKRTKCEKKQQKSKRNKTIEMNAIRKFFKRTTTDDISSIDESDFDSSIADSISTGSELAVFDPPRQQTSIGNIRIRASNDVTIGNRIIYRGPVTIHQQVISQRYYPQAAASTSNRNANIPRQLGEYGSMIQFIHWQ